MEEQLVRMVESNLINQSINQSINHASKIGFACKTWCVARKYELVNSDLQYITILRSYTGLLIPVSSVYYLSGLFSLTLRRFAT